MSFGGLVINRPRLTHDPAIGIAILAVGILLITVTSHFEGKQNSDAPLENGLLGISDQPPWDDAIPALIQKLPLSNFPEYEQALKMFEGTPNEEQADELKNFLPRERCILMDLTDQRLAGIVASGRAPIPGANEALAGHWAKRDTFEIDGEIFTVVGRITRTASGLSFAYVIPVNIDIQQGYALARDDWAAGWYHPNGIERLQSMDEGEREQLSGVTLIRPSIPARPKHAWAVVIGLVLVALGGALAQTQLLVHLSRRPFGILTPILGAIRAHPILYTLCHFVLYGTLFTGMAIALFLPAYHLMLLEVTTQQFESGGLAYVADAYASGNIPLAAAMTFVNNYFMATVATTALPSLFIPFAGVLINALRFGLVGFVMSPMSADMASTYIFHSITLTLELEAYVIAVFAICLWPISIARSFRHDGEWKIGLKAMASGTLLTGIMLAIAALYEAASLILLAAAGQL